MELNCPDCRIVLQAQRIAPGTGYRCGQCQGAWVNLALLRSRLGVPLVRSFWRQATNGGRKTDKPCSACSQPMMCFSTTDLADPVELDLCRGCQSVWFDGGELERFRTSVTGRRPLARPALGAPGPAEFTATGHDILDVLSGVVWAFS